MLRSKRHNSGKFAILFLFLFLLILPALQEAKETTVSQDLQSAYQLEHNSYQLYEAFSQKAEQEGYPRTALLFRAIMRSTKVKIGNHADAIKRLSGTAQEKSQTPVVKTTAENLREAIKKESYKTGELYPGFIKKARQERNKFALRTFNGSKSAGGEYLKFLKEAAADLSAWEKKEINYWVCTICAHMVSELNFKECPICFNPLDKYVQVK